MIDARNLLQEKSLDFRPQKVVLRPALKARWLHARLYIYFGSLIYFLWIESFKSISKRVWPQKLPLRRGILFASTEVMCRPKSNSPLHFDIENISQHRTEKENASARCLPPTAMLARWPQVCRVTEDHV